MLDGQARVRIGEPSRHTITRPVVVQSVTPVADTQVYACGPVRMLAALEACCAAWPADALRTEHFVSTAGALDPAKEHAFEVELKDSSVTLSVATGQTLLAALRAANINVQSDCEEGLCACARCVC